MIINSVKNSSDKDILGNFLQKWFLFAFLLVGASGLLVISGDLNSSGGYSGGVGINTDKPGGMDRELYELGKSIYAGKISRNQMDSSIEIEQIKRLARIQGSLPRVEQSRVDLMKYAGKLSERDLSALEHFVGIRFNAHVKEK